MGKLPLVVEDILNISTTVFMLHRFIVIFVARPRIRGQLHDEKISLLFQLERTRYFSIDFCHAEKPRHYLFMYVVFSFVRNHLLLFLFLSDIHAHTNIHLIFILSLSKNSLLRKRWQYLFITMRLYLFTFVWIDKEEK